MARELENRIRPPLTMTIKRKLSFGTRNRETVASELVQIVWCKLLTPNRKALRDLKWHNDEAIFPFVKKVAKNVVVDWSRNRQIQIIENAKSFDDPDNPLPLQAPVFLDYNITKEEIDKCLWAAFGAEPDFNRDRAMFWLYQEQQYTARQIAGLPSVNLTQKKVENILHRMNVAVRSRLGNRKEKEAL